MRLCPLPSHLKPHCQARAKQWTLFSCTQKQILRGAKWKWGAVERILSCWFFFFFWPYSEPKSESCPPSLKKVESEYMDKYCSAFEYVLSLCLFPRFVGFFPPFSQSSCMAVARAGSLFAFIPRALISLAIFPSAASSSGSKAYILCGHLFIRIPISSWEEGEVGRSPVSFPRVLRNYVRVVGSKGDFKRLFLADLGCCRTYPPGIWLNSIPLDLLPEALRAHLSAVATWEKGCPEMLV